MQYRAIHLVRFLLLDLFQFLVQCPEFYFGASLLWSKHTRQLGQHHEVLQQAGIMSVQKAIYTRVYAKTTASGFRPHTKLWVSGKMLPHNEHKGFVENSQYHSFLLDWSLWQNYPKLHMKIYNYYFYWTSHSFIWLWCSSRSTTLFMST